MSPFASQLLLMALLALCGVWLHHYITRAPRDVARPQWTEDDLVWRDHVLSPDEAAWEDEWFDDDLGGQR